VRVEPIDPQRHNPQPLWAATHGSPGREATWDFMGYGPFYAYADFRTWFTATASSDDPMWFVLVDRKADQPIGMATFMRITPAHGVIEVGNIWFVPEVRGSVRTTEAISLLMRHAMGHHYRRLEWKCDALNLASRRAALRLGFRFEGVFFNHLVVKGRNRDTAWFSISAEEWPAINAAIKSWLAPSNFDADGRERTSLREGTAGLW
jgi:RimJ/RimL family protein N-acetyltransferase